MLFENDVNYGGSLVLLFFFTSKIMRVKNSWKVKCDVSSWVYTFKTSDEVFGWRTWRLNAKKNFPSQMADDSAVSFLKMYSFQIIFSNIQILSTNWNKMFPQNLEFELNV